MRIAATRYRFERLELAQRRLNMGKSRLMWLGVLAALVFAARGASAQAVGRAFGEKGQAAISAERLLGVYVRNAEAEQTGTISGAGPDGVITRNTEDDSTTFVLLGSGAALGPAAIPRLAVDFFVIDRLSIGGALLYWSDSSEREVTGTNDFGGGGPAPIDRDRTETDTHVFGISPRVGYAYMFSPTFGLWPRAGFSYVNQKIESRNEDIDSGNGAVTATNTETKLDVFALTLEGFLIISPFEHVAFGVGPFLEWGFAGNAETEVSAPPALAQADGDLNTTTFGITSSLIAWF
jgi:hypothetical protein